VSSEPQQVSGVDASDAGTVITHGKHHLAYPSVFRVEEQSFCIADSSDPVGIPVSKERAHDVVARGISRGRAATN